MLKPALATSVVSLLFVTACAPQATSSAPAPAPSSPTASTTITADVTKPAAPVANVAGAKKGVSLVGAEAPDTTAQNYTTGRYYGAISLASDAAVGYSYDYSTKTKALNAAQKACKRASRRDSTCRKIVWVRNGCAAVAIKWNGRQVTRYGWAVRDSKNAAIKAAKSKCGKTCIVRAYTCTTR